MKVGNYITEPQFYKLAIKANNETAEKFQDWVTEEVLPSIRKNGAYLTSKKIEEVLLNPDTIILIACLGLTFLVAIWVVISVIKVLQGI